MVWSALVYFQHKSLTYAVSVVSVSWQICQGRMTTFRYFILKSDTKASICKNAFLNQWKPSRTTSEVKLPLYTKYFFRGKSSVNIKQWNIQRM